MVESLDLTDKKTETISMPENLTTSQILDVQVCVCSVCWGGGGWVWHMCLFAHDV